MSGQPQQSWFDRIALLVLMAVFAWRNGLIDPGVLPIPSPDDPAPFALPGNRCLMLEDKGSRAALSGDRLAILTGGTVRDYLMTHCAEGPDGSPEFRIWDIDQDLENVPDAWRKVVETAKADPEFEPPWMVISNGKTGTHGPLPASPDAMVAELRRFFE